MGGEQIKALTPRAQVAAMMMQGFCANPAVFAHSPTCGWSLVNATEQQLAEYCLELADALERAGAQSEPAPVQWSEAAVVKTFEDYFDADHRDPAMGMEWRIWTAAFAAATAAAEAQARETDNG